MNTSCLSCGSVLPINIQFCGECGKPLFETNSPSQKFHLSTKSTIKTKPNKAKINNQRVNKESKKTNDLFTSNLYDDSFSQFQHPRFVFVKSEKYFSPNTKILSQIENKINNPVLSIDQSKQKSISFEYFHLSSHPCYWILNRNIICQVYLMKCQDQSHRKYFLRLSIGEGSEICTIDDLSDLKYLSNQLCRLISSEEDHVDLFAINPNEAYILSHLERNYLPKIVHRISLTSESKYFMFKHFLDVNISQGGDRIWAELTSASPGTRSCQEIRQLISGKEDNLLLQGFSLRFDSSIFTLRHRVPFFGLPSSPPLDIQAKISVLFSSPLFEEGLHRASEPSPSLDSIDCQVRGISVEVFPGSSALLGLLSPHSIFFPWAAVSGLLRLPPDCSALQGKQSSLPLLRRLLGLLVVGTPSRGEGLGLCLWITGAPLHGLSPLDYFRLPATERNESEEVPPPVEAPQETTPTPLAPGDCYSEELDMGEEGGKVDMEEEVASEVVKDEHTERVSPPDTDFFTPPNPIPRPTCLIHPEDFSLSCACHDVCRTISGTRLRVSGDWSSLHSEGLRLMACDLLSGMTATLELDRETLGRLLRSLAVFASMATAPLVIQLSQTYNIDSIQHRPASEWVSEEPSPSLDPSSLATVEGLLNRPLKDFFFIWICCKLTLFLSRQRRIMTIRIEKETCSNEGF